MRHTSLEDLEKILATDPNNLPVRLRYASLLYAMEQDEQAMKESQTVLASDPTNIDALILAAQTAERLGDTAKASGYRTLLNALQRTDESAAFPLDDWNDDDTIEDPSVVGMAVAERDEFLGFDNDPFWEVEKSTVRLDDVAGLDDVKRRLNLAFLAPLRNPEMTKLYGKTLRGGLLLYGPPGCGKTFIARAVAGEMGAKFISVGLADVLDMWIGSSEKNINEIFKQARRNAPCVLFFDEVDALGRKRSLNRASGGGVINQLLAELDGTDHQNEGVFILAATNHPWDVDTALRRPGRLDRTVLVLPPDVPARRAILELNLKDRPVEKKLDLDTIAKRTDEYSGADIAHLVESAVEYALERSLETGTVSPISMDDFKRSLKEIKPSVRSWFEIAKNYALFANDGGVYDDMLAYLRHIKMI
jgi:SpoVK/Ycf46/Vps4 family AAA+-type ATPase